MRNKKKKRKGLQHIIHTEYKLKNALTKANKKKKKSNFVFSGLLFG